MRTVTIGTTVTLLANANPARRRWSLQFVPSSIIAGNTGKVYIGRGFTPTATDGDANQGDVLSAGSSIEEKKAFPDDVLPWKGMLWFVASAAGQILVFDEQSASDAGSAA